VILMKILLISANREITPDPVAPIGLAYLASALEREGFSVGVLDLCFAEEISATIRRKKEAFGPDAIGVSIRNVDSTGFPHGHSYLPEIEEICEAAKERFDGPVILGGAGFSILPKAFMERFGMDFGIVGEGEQVLPVLLRAISRQEGLEAIPGVCRQLPGSRIEIHPIEPAWSLTGLNTKGWEYLEAERYYQRGGMVNIQTKRGCTFQCLYCTYPLSEGTKLRTRPPLEVVDEIEEWTDSHRINQFFFVDSVFNFPLDHAESILSEICRRGLKIGWTAYINPRFVTPSFGRLMAQSGCSGVELGVDSGSNRILKGLRKEFNVEDVRRSIKLCHDERLHCCVSLLLGGPAETPQSLQESLELMDSSEVNAVIANVGIRIYPGCGLHELSLQEEKITEDDSLLEPTFYLSSHLTDRDVAKIFQEARKRGNWIVPGAGINFDSALFQRMRGKKIKGPLWRFVRKKGRSIGRS
jgi:radical SAM superfamily enzyme YgiQ (UPF0313 family)